MFLGANTPEYESSEEPIRSGERKFQGARRPGSKSSRERIGQGPIGRFAPGSKLAQERKGCESSPTTPTNLHPHHTSFYTCACGWRLFYYSGL